MVETITVEIPKILIDRIRYETELCNLCPPTKKVICYLNKGEYCEEYKLIRRVHKRIVRRNFVVFPMACWNCHFRDTCYMFRHRKFNECPIARVK